MIAAVMLVLVTACIKNDIPYPRIQANFLTFNVEGQGAGTVVDSLALNLNVTLDESADIYAVNVADYTVTPGAELLEDITSQPVDLSSPLRLTLRLYQDYVWTVRATQNIERYFEVEGQIGQSVIDVPGRRILVQVRRGADLSQLRVIRAKLANAGSTIFPNIADGGVIDARRPVALSVEAFGRAAEWTVYVETVQETVRTVSVDAWTCVAWIYGQAEAGRANGAQYRIAGTEEWTDVPDDAVTHNGGAFTARVDHLSASTTYEARAVSGNDVGETMTVTTGSVVQMPNSDFDNWWLDGKIWCPWAEGGTPYWGTGNKGATTLGNSNTVPTDDTPSGSGWAAMLETRFIGIGSIGKLAAGNLFAGDYVRTDGTNGVLALGRSFSERPTRLRGMYKYTGSTISHSDADHKNLIGRPDTCIVWVALIDSDQPFEIRTNPKDRNLFNPDGPEVIAYGKMEQSQTVEGYIPFQFDLEYKSTSRVPKYILLTASASKYGDFFTGGSGSVLYIDDFVLEYDY
ncbi:MAG: PCMD domain-containing protein [Muribaculaceae bacterium]|nr:PCMD domain-containing protein [Muribaculaceae bacterium]